MYYVYIHKRNTDGSPFYVGKGAGRRAWVIRGRSRHWNNIVSKNGFSVEVVQEFTSEEDAFLLECWLIAKFRHEGIPLCNLTDGGEGASGQVKSIEERKAISERMRGRPVPESVRRKLAKDEKYDFVNADGRIINATQYDMFKLGHLTSSQACALVRGRRLQCRGWSIRGVELKGKSGKDNGMFDHSEYRFENDCHGVVVCTRSQLISSYGLSDSKVSLVISGQRKSHKGWRISIPEDGN